VRVDPNYQLWVEDRDNPGKTPLLLIMGASYSGIAWPEPLIDLLAGQHRVIRYDHRDTGRSTWAFDAHSYAMRDLARDTVTVLDALRIDRAHVVGLSMGGVLAQLLLLDYPHRLHSASVLCTCALGVGLADPDGRSDVELPGPEPQLLARWRDLAEERDRDEEIVWRVENWRILNGAVLPFDAEEFHALEERVIDHSRTVRYTTAHARADQSGLDRTPELARVRVPTQVIEGPEDPVHPPPHSAHLAAVLGGARLTTIPGMGHALVSSIVEPLAKAILSFTAAVDGAMPAAAT